MFIATVLAAFVAAQPTGGEEPNMAAMYFDMVDMDQSGSISQDEILGFINGFGAMMAPESANLSTKKKKALVKRLMTKMDTNGSGEIDLEEAVAGEGMVFEMIQSMSPPKQDL